MCSDISDCMCDVTLLPMHVAIYQADCVMWPHYLCVEIYQSDISDILCRLTSLPHV